MAQLCGCKGIRTCLICEKILNASQGKIGSPLSYLESRSYSEVMERRGEFSRPTIRFEYCKQCNLCQVNKSFLSDCLTQETRNKVSGHLNLILGNNPTNLKLFCIEFLEKTAAERPQSENVHFSSSTYEKAAHIANKFQGIHLIENFITLAISKKVLEEIETKEWKPSQSGRRKQDYGPKVNFKKKKINLNNFKGFLKSTKHVVDALYSDVRLFRNSICNSTDSHHHTELATVESNENEQSILADFVPIECGVIEYDPTQGASIDRHFDDTWLWGDRLVTLSLISDSVMSFAFDDKQLVEVDQDHHHHHHETSIKEDLQQQINLNGDVKEIHVDKKIDTKKNTFGEIDLMASSSSDGSSRPQNLLVEIRVPLPENSLLIMGGPAREVWTHAIHRQDITQRRISMTFREAAAEFQPGGAQEEAGRQLTQIAATYQG